VKPSKVSLQPSTTSQSNIAKQHHEHDRDGRFNYQIDKVDKMTLFHHGRTIKLLKSKDALKLHEKLIMAPEDEQQRMMASATSNYKRGNEKL
jgi:hypothetical protein